MTPPADNEALRQRLTVIVTTFQQVGPRRYAKLLPIKDLIAELRQKGASYEVIREILASVSVSVSLDTLGRFCRDEVEQRAARTTHPRKRLRPATDSKTSSAPGPSRPQLLMPDASQPSSLSAPSTDPSADRSRHRGPRIASSHRESTQ